MVLLIPLCLVKELSTHEVDGKRQAGEVRECVGSVHNEKMCANLVIPDEGFANVEMKLAHLRLLLLSPSMSNLLVSAF